MNCQTSWPPRRDIVGTFLASIATIVVASWPGHVWATSAAGTILDPLGDSVSHDVASASAFFDATYMRLHAAFYPGTLNANNLAFVFAFDLDQNPATGTQPPALFSLGGDAILTFNSLMSFAEARIAAVSVPVSFGVDSFSIALPLEVLGDDGQANFGLMVGDPSSANTFSGRDIASGGDLGHPLSAPTLLIPEPASAALAGVCALCAAAGVVRLKRRA